MPLFLLDPLSVSLSSATRSVAQDAAPDGHSEAEGRDDVSHEGPLVQSSEKWRKAVLALKASARFRCSAKIVKLSSLRRWRTCIAALRATRCFKRLPILSGAPATREDITADDLAHLTQNRNSELLEERGGLRGLAKVLPTDLQRGIAGDDDEIKRRKEKYGENTYLMNDRKSMSAFVWLLRKNLTLISLVISGMFSFIQKNGWHEGASIASAVIVIVCVRGISGYMQSQWSRAMIKEMNDIQVQVVRGGKKSSISMAELVVGDLVTLRSGDQIPADGLQVLRHDLSEDESELVHKDQKRFPLISGCEVEASVSGGESWMLVTVVGKRTEWAQHMAVMSNDSAGKTPLQIRLHGLVSSIEWIDVSVAVLVFLILLGFYLAGHGIGHNREKRFKAGKTSVGKALLALVDIIVIAMAKISVAVPDGLPLSVSLAFSHSMTHKMSKIWDCHHHAILIDCDSQNNTMRSQQGAHTEISSGPTDIEPSMGCEGPEMGGERHEMGAEPSMAIERPEMGIGRPEIIEQGPDIGISDDNFASIVKGVHWGGSVYRNVKKFIQFHLTVNISALAVILISAVYSGNALLTTTQLLWVNLIMHTLGALAFATEKSTDVLLHRCSVDLHEPLITSIMLRNILGQLLFQVAVFLTLILRGKSILKLNGSKADRVHSTIIFNLFVLCQIFNMVNSRELKEQNIFKGILKNKLFIGIIFITLITQVVIVEFLGRFTTATKLDWQQWLVCISIAFLSWPIAFIVKYLPVPKMPVLSAYRSCWERMKQN